MKTPWNARRCRYARPHPDGAERKLPSTGRPRSCCPSGATAAEAGAQNCLARSPAARKCCFLREALRQPAPQASAAAPPHRRPAASRLRQRARLRKRLASKTPRSSGKLPVRSPAAPPALRTLALPIAKLDHGAGCFQRRPRNRSATPMTPFGMVGPAPAAAARPSSATPGRPAPAERWSRPPPPATFGPVQRCHEASCPCSARTARRMPAAQRCAFRPLPAAGPSPRASACTRRAGFAHVRTPGAISTPPASTCPSPLRGL
mmetsp:Transcript_118892/g.343895  ORF Transcript_118892/g.343895 Transcript_118892/m.343895 type:complete len:262 (+) Transcript_118892:475-1260(+)